MCRRRFRQWNYDGNINQTIDAETYAILAGYSKDDIISAENDNDPYYFIDDFEYVIFYINNAGKLFTTSGASV